MKLAKWILENFGAILLFQAALHFFGLRPAISLSLAYVVAELIYLKIQNRSVTSFMKFSYALVIVFSLADLYLQNSPFFAFEPVATNLAVAVYFGMSLLKEKTIIEELAEQQGRTSSDRNPDKTFFFQFLTSVWFGYYILKTIIYAWLALYTSLETSFIIRMIIGSISFYAMLTISIGFRRQIWWLLEILKWMPSKRSAPTTTA